MNKTRILASDLTICSNFNYIGLPEKYEFRNTKVIYLYNLGMILYEEKKNSKWVPTIQMYTNNF